MGARSIAAIVALAVLPAVALAGPGWQIVRFHVFPGFASHATATHCGVSKFGKYTLRLNAVGTKGADKGKTLHAVARVALLNDHRPHTLRLVSVTGTALSKLTPAQRRTYQSRQGTALARLAFKVLASTSNSVTLQLWIDGAPAATGAKRTLSKIHC